FNGLTSVSVFTDSNGIANAPTFVAGNPGACSVTATLVGSSLTMGYNFYIYDPSSLRVLPVELPERWLNPGQLDGDGFLVGLGDGDTQGNAAIGVNATYTVQPNCGLFTAGGATQTVATVAGGLAGSIPYNAPNSARADCFVDVSVANSTATTRFEIHTTAPGI